MGGVYFLRGSPTGSCLEIREWTEERPNPYGPYSHGPAFVNDVFDDHISQRIVLCNHLGAFYGALPFLSVMSQQCIVNLHWCSIATHDRSVEAYCLKHRLSGLLCSARLPRHHMLLCVHDRNITAIPTAVMPFKQL